MGRIRILAMLLVAAGSSVASAQGGSTGGYADSAYGLVAPQAQYGSYSGANSSGSLAVPYAAPPARSYNSSGSLAVQGYNSSGSELFAARVRIFSRIAARRAARLAAIAPRSVQVNVNVAAPAPMMLQAPCPAPTMQDCVSKIEALQQRIAALQAECQCGEACQCAGECTCGSKLASYYASKDLEKYPSRPELAFK